MRTLFVIAALGAVSVSLSACAELPVESVRPPMGRMDTGGSGCTETIGAPTDPCVERIVGRVGDADGRPIAGALITLCGMGQCRDLMPDASGAFDLPLSARMNPALFALHAEVPGQPYALLYAPLAPVRAGLAAFASPIRLPRMSAEGPAIVRGASPGQTVTAGDVTLEIPPGAMILPSIADEGRALTLRSVGVPMFQVPGFAEGAGLRALYALAPTALTSSLAMRVRIRNRAELPAGQRVELVTMGSELESERFTAGTTVVLGPGRVSADGQFIEADPGVGPRELHWIGVRAR
jgi:hypothetical protein